jgi:hypothetical protein
MDATRVYGIHRNGVAPETVPLALSRSRTVARCRRIRRLQLEGLCATKEQKGA